MLVYHNTYPMWSRKPNLHVWILPWLNGYEIQQHQHSKMSKLMPITQVADAPPCQADGTLPPFTLFSCSRSDESAFYRYFTHTAQMCQFFACLDSRHSILNVSAVFLSVFFCISSVFMPFLRSSSFANPLLFDKSAIGLIINHYHSEGRWEADGRQNGLTTYSQPSGILRFCKQSC